MDSKVEPELPPGGGSSESVLPEQQAGKRQTEQPVSVLGTAAPDVSTAGSAPSVAPGESAAAALKQVIDEQSSTERFGKRRSKIEPILLTIFVVLSALGFWLAATKSESVFPSASISISVPRETIVRQATNLAAEIAYAKSNPITSILFSYDDSAKTFLEYEFGTGKANQLMQAEVPVWYWETKLCKEFEQEQFSAEYDPAGRLVSCDHWIPNDVARPSVSAAEAETMATRFIASHFGISLAKYKRIHSSSTAQLHRVDHSFTWEDTSKEFKGAHLRVTASIAGNQIRSISRFLHVPEQWDRKYSTIRSYNALLGSIAWLFVGIFMALVPATLIYFLTQRAIRWKFSLIAAGVFAGVTLLESLNDINSLIASYNTDMAFSAHIFQSVLDAVLGAVGQFVWGFCLFAAGEACYRKLYPKHLAVESFFTRKGLSTRAGLYAVVLGYLLCGVSFAWQISYYFAGEHVGFWTPLGIDNYKVLSSVFPVISAMSLGLSASALEEITCRVIALGLLTKLTRNFWLANLIQALAWGFAHSTYPQQPCYARGVELTVEGLFFGWVLRRYGIMPCIISHYLFDALYTIRPFLFSAIPAIAWPSLLAVVPFLFMLVAGAYWVRRQGGFGDRSVAANETVAAVTTQAEESEPAVVRQWQYEVLSRRTRIGLLLSAVACALIVLAIKRPVVESTPTLNVSKQQALEAARKSLDDRKIARAGLYEVPRLTADSAFPSQYIFENGSYAKANSLWHALDSGYQWQVRFFKPMQSEEYDVAIAGDTGKEYSFVISKEENAPGASLTEPTARKMCEDYLSAKHANLTPFVFDSSAKSIRKNRCDYSFTFKVPQYKVAEADFKVTVSVVGDLVSGFYYRWEIPQKWSFERNKHTTRDEVASALRSCLSVICGLVCLWWAFTVMRSSKPQWFSALKWSCLLALFTLQSIIASIPTFYSYYATTTPMTTFWIERFIGYFAAFASACLSYTLAIVFVTSVFKKLLPNVSLDTVRTALLAPKAPADRRAQYNMWLDATICCLCLPIISGALIRTTQLAYSLFSPGMQTDDPYSIICSAGNVLNILLYKITPVQALGSLAGAVIVAAVYIKFIRRFWVLAALVIGWTLMTNLDARYWQDYLIQFASTSCYLVLTWAFFTRFMRFNPIAWLLASTYTGLLAAFPYYCKFGTHVFGVEIFEIAIALLLPVLFTTYLYVRLPRQVAQPN